MAQSWVLPTSHTQDDHDRSPHMLSGLDFLGACGSHNNRHVLYRGTSSLASLLATPGRPASSSHWLSRSRLGSSDADWPLGSGAGLRAGKERNIAAAAAHLGFHGWAGAGGGLLAGARGDAGLHRGLHPNHRRSAAGTPQPLPALLQPAPGVPEVPGLEAHHYLPLLRAPGIWILLQHGLRVPLLPYAGGGFLPRSKGRLRLHVSLRWYSYDSAGIPGKPLFPGTGPHGHAGLRLEPAEPSRESQLLRLTQLPGTIPALGPHGLLDVAGQLSPYRPARDYCGPHLLLPRRCLPQPAWRQEAAADPQLSEATIGRPTGGPQLPAPSRRATRALTAALGTVVRHGPQESEDYLWMPSRDLNS